MKMGRMISVRMKFFSGIDKELSLHNYNPAEGIVIHVPSGTRLRRVLKDLGAQRRSSYVCFRNGQRIGMWTKLHDGDEVSCLKPSGGG